MLTGVPQAWEQKLKKTWGWALRRDPSPPPCSEPSLQRSADSADSRGRTEDVNKVCPAHLSPCSPDSSQPHVKQSIILFVATPMPGGDANRKAVRELDCFT